MGFSGGTSGKESACQRRRCKRRGFDPQVRKIPCWRKWWRTPVFLPEKMPWTGESGGLQSAAAAAKSLQVCLTLCDPIDGSPPGSPVPGILQARTLEWVAISFSKALKWKWKWSRVRLLATPWTAAYQAPPPMGFSRQEYWSGVPLPSLGLQSMGLQRVEQDWHSHMLEK